MDKGNLNQYNWFRECIYDKVIKELSQRKVYKSILTVV